MSTSQLIVLTLLVAALVGLWSVLPHWLFLVLVAAAAYAVIKAKSSPAVEPPTIDTHPRYDQNPSPIVADFPDRIAQCRHFMALENWDAARDILQRFAYTILNEPQEEKDRFKVLMTEFAAQDPLVGGVLQVIMPILRAQPGMLQTELYKHLPGVGLEQARYALYFLEQLQVVERKKSGRSYKVYEARPVIDA